MREVAFGRSAIGPIAGVGRQAALSVERDDDLAVSAALLDATRDIFTHELMGVIEDIASRLDPTHPEAAQTDALTIFGLMIGTLQLARALTDRDLSDQLLARGVETALKLLDDPA